MLVLVRLGISVISLLYFFYSKYFKRKVPFLNSDEVLSQVKKSKNGSLVSVEFMTSLSRNFFFRFSSENSLHKFFKKIGLANEFVIGDEEIDQKFYIVSDHPGLNRWFFKNSEFIGVLKKLLCLGIDEIQCDRSGHLIFRSAQVSSVDREKEINEAIKKMKQVLEGIQLSLTDVDSYFWRFICLEVVMLAFSIFGAMGILASKVGFEPLLVESDVKVIFWGIQLGFGLFFSWLLAAILLLRKSSRLVLLIGDGLVGAAFLVFSGVQIVVDINEFFDRSTPVIIEAKINKIYTREYGSGKNRTTRTYMRVEYASAIQDMPRELLMRPFQKFSFREGGGLRVIVRHGFLGLKYIDEMKPMVEPPYITKAGVDRAAEDISKKIQDLKKWKAIEQENLIPEQSIRWFEEKYENGQLKSLEPEINGQKQGWANYWHPNGQMYAKIFWLNGAKHGQFQLYRENGRIEQDLSYKQGLPHGLCKWYSDNGELTHIAVYEDGRLISSDPNMIQ